MLQPAARDQHAGVDQRLDDRFVDITLFAFVIDDALAGEARSRVRKSAVLVDRVRNGRIDPAVLQFAFCLQSRSRSRRGHVRALYARSRFRLRRLHDRRQATAPENHNRPCLSADDHKSCRRARACRRLRTFSKLLTRACLKTASANLSARMRRSPVFTQLSAGASPTL